MRFWSALFGLLCCTLTGFFVKKQTGSLYWGAAAALVLAANPHWVNRTREGLLDSGLVLSMLAAFALLTWWDSRRVWTGVALGLVLAAGVLIKNPLDLLIVPFGLLARPVVVGQRPAWRSAAIGTALAVAVAIGWHGFQAIRWGEAYWDSQHHTAVERFFRVIEGHDRPWTLFLGSWLKSSTFDSILLTLTMGLTAWLHPRRLWKVTPYLGFVALWLILIHCSASKRDVYLIAVFPFTATISMVLLHALWKESRRRGLAALGLGGLFVLSAWLFAKGYVATPDYSMGLKEVAIEASAVAEPEETILFAQYPSHAVGFYARRIVPNVPIVELPNRMGAYTTEGRPVRVIVTRRTDADAVEETLGRAGLKWKRLVYGRRYVSLQLVDSVTEDQKETESPPNVSQREDRS